MEVIVAKSAGFCFGVKKAVDKVYEVANTKKNVYTYGPIIHNEEVVNDLKNKDVEVLHDIKDIDNLDNRATVVIRSHGVDKTVYDKLTSKGIDIVDATCPFVLKIHNIVKKDSGEDRKIVIIGNENHPEVQGIMGWCINKPTVIEDEEQALNLEFMAGEKVSIVSQTTFNYNKFKELVEIISKKGYDVFVYNTICNATEVRQTEARELAADVEAMIIIGGKNSSNTQKLYEISKKECANTYYIQTLVDLDLTTFESFSRVGITAGASTPNNIIKEVHSSMAEDFAKMFEESCANDNLVGNGKIVEGTVISVKEDEIALNINYKADGIITRSEYTNEPGVDLTTLVKVGDTMQAKVVKVNDGEGQVLLSYKRVAQEKANEQLREAYENKEVLKAKVTQVLDGGLSVVVNEAKVFIPASLVSDSYEKNLEKYKNQEIEFVITEFDPRKRRIIGNRKQLLLADKAEKAKELFAKIKVGDTVTGTVKNVTDFGAFIDLGGADGLLHISEMSWGRVENPKKLFNVGDEVTALIKDIQGEKIALSLKFDNANPWIAAAEKYAVGNEVKGKIARMTDFGAFVELEPGVDALLHVSQISKEHVEKPSDVLKVGEIIDAKVVDFKVDEKKISLSMKALLPEDEENTEE